MSAFETMYAESLYRDLVRLSDTAKQVDRERILARMIDNVNEAVRDEVISADLVSQIAAFNVDHDPQDLVDSIHRLIQVHFIPVVHRVVS
jgi:2-phospho-L-lactate guanylyltransferase (CobY/MobA/RfbA family)